MVGAPVSYSGNQPPPPAGTNPPMNPDAAAIYAPPPQQLCSPNAPISTLLPYGGAFPANINPPTSSAPFNTSYLYPPNPAVSSGVAQPPPFPPCSTVPYPPNPANTPATYPPSAPPLYTPATYPPTSSAPPPFAGAYPPVSGMNQIPGYLSPQPPPSGYPAGAGDYAPPYGAYSAAAPPGGGFYPPRY